MTLSGHSETITGELVEWKVFFVKSCTARHDRKTHQPSVKTVKRYGSGEISCCSHFKMRADIQIAICRQLILVYFAHTIESSRNKMVTIHSKSLSCTYWVLSIIVLLLCAIHICTTSWSNIHNAPIFDEYRSQSATILATPWIQAHQGDSNKTLHHLWVSSRVPLTKANQG